MGDSSNMQRCRSQQQELAQSDHEGRSSLPRTTGDHQRYSFSSGYSACDELNDLTSSASTLCPNEEEERVIIPLEPPNYVSPSNSSDIDVSSFSAVEITPMSKRSNLFSIPQENTSVPPLIKSPNPRKRTVSHSNSFFPSSSSSPYMRHRRAHSMCSPVPPDDYGIQVRVLSCFRAGDISNPLGKSNNYLRSVSMSPRCLHPKRKEQLFDGPTRNAKSNYFESYDPSKYYHPESLALRAALEHAEQEERKWALPRRIRSMRSGSRIIEPYTKHPIARRSCTPNIGRRSTSFNSHSSNSPERRYPHEIPYRLRSPVFAQQIYNKPGELADTLTRSSPQSVFDKHPSYFRESIFSTVRSSPISTSDTENDASSNIYDSMKVNPSLSNIKNSSKNTEGHKNTSMDYKQSALHTTNLQSPVKADNKSMESYNTHFTPDIGVPVLPLRNNLRHQGVPSPPSSYEGRMGDRGGGGRSAIRHLSLHQHGAKAPQCSWRCTAIIFITIAVVLAAMLGFLAVKNMLAVAPNGPGCTVLIDEQSSPSDEPLPPKRGKGSHSPHQTKEKHDGVFFTFDGNLPTEILSFPRLYMRSNGPKTPRVKRMPRSVSHDSREPSMSSRGSSHTPTPNYIHSSQTPSTARTIPPSVSSLTPHQNNTLQHSISSNIWSATLLNYGQANTLPDPENSTLATTSTSDTTQSISVEFVPNVDIAEYVEIDDEGSIINYIGPKPTLNISDMDAPKMDFEYGDVVSSGEEELELIEYEDASDVKDLNPPKNFIPTNVDGLIDEHDIFATTTEATLPPFSNLDEPAEEIKLNHKDLLTGEHSRKLVIDLNNNEKFDQSSLFATTPKVEELSKFALNKMERMREYHEESGASDVHSAMVGDDPNVYTNENDKGGRRDLWSLGWIFSQKKGTKESANDDQTKLSTPSPFTNSATQYKIDASYTKGGKKSYIPFSTWSKKDDIQKPGPAKKTPIKYTKGGKISKDLLLKDKEYNKRSPKPETLEATGRSTAFQRRRQIKADGTTVYVTSFTSPRKLVPESLNNNPHSFALQKHPPFDPMSPNSKDIKQHDQQAGKAGSPKIKTAYELFPHLFDYELPDHDEYYYVEDKVLFDDIWPQEDNYEESIFIYDDHKPEEATTTTPVESITETSAQLEEDKLPEGLKAMSLTKEKYEGDTKEKATHYSVSSETLPENKKSYLKSDIPPKESYIDPQIEIVPLEYGPAGNPEYFKNYPLHKDPIHKTANDVLMHTTHIPYVAEPFVANSKRNFDSNEDGVYKDVFNKESATTPDRPIRSLSNAERPFLVQVPHRSTSSREPTKSTTAKIKTSSTITNTQTEEPTTTEVNRPSNPALNTNHPHALDSHTRAPTIEYKTTEPNLSVSEFSHRSSINKAKRVTVNVTIAADKESPESNSVEDIPLYVLSISIPTSGEGGNAEVSILSPQQATDHSKSPKITVKANQNVSLPYIQRVTVTPPPLYESERTYTKTPTPCDCSCPCAGKNTPTTLPPEMQNNLHNKTSFDTNPGGNENTTNNSAPRDCIIVYQNNSSNGTPYHIYHLPSATTTQSTTTTTTTIPPPPPELLLQIQEHKQRPQQTIPPDGTTFKRITLGRKLKHDIPPYGYWNMQFYQAESAYVRFEVAVPRGASLGIYGRRNALPTHTSYDFLKVLSGYKVGAPRNARSSLAPTQVEQIVKYLEQGQWFLSVYNDDGDTQALSLGAEVSSAYTEGCPKGCSGNGDCILGSCQCNPGFTGPDCTQMKCPVLCSNHGEYREGQCICRPGWKGQECSVRHDECEVPDCSGHGHCVDGRCRCANGFKGEFCEDVDCPHPTCSGHGWCVNGTCICQKGWRGLDCSHMDDAALECLPDCSGHGHFDLIGQQCVCEPEWTGSECSKRVCGLDCGYHGRCEGGECLCSDGWTGDRCDLKTCDPRCEEHGQCKNGTCICMTGWNGRHCTIAGCPGSCTNHGSCILIDDEWSCSCQNGWEGVDCATKKEDNCADSIDNDNDGLTDCADSECCSAKECTQSVLCKSSHDPIDILLRKQPPAVTASFFQKMRFIVEENSVQVYAEYDAFNQSRSSIVRGRIVTGRGSGLVGVRVSHYRPKDMGFTLSRQGGWFDLMVNGGGAVKLFFGKSQFNPVVKTVWAPWNEIVVIDTVMMTTSEIVPPPPTPACPDHNYVSLKPVVLATWKHGFQGGCPECSAILTESQVVQESLAIPGTGLQLVYHSSRALGYESTIQLQLTPSEIPTTLRRIFLRITIEGILFEKTFEADPDIKYTYAWNRLNVYRQRVYGVTWAIVRVGYAYSNCDQTIWDAQSTQVSGHDMSISEIGGWDLSIHNRYNFHEGILQKGDGTNMYLKQQPRILDILMGDGRQREVSCRSCDGAADKQRLLTPAALASAPDGSLYVADFNLIRRIFPDKTVKTVVQLNETRVSYRYHLAVSPVDGSVYISDPEAHQILKVRDPEDTSKPEDNYMTYIGSGERCLPGDEIGCGDGGLARDAKLQYPKGLVVSSEEVLYFADGTNVRSVDSDGIISTVIGTHRHRAHWQPLPCLGTLSVVDVSLRWPTSLAVSPLDESLYVLDDHHILRLTRDGRVKVIAGRPLHCPPLITDGPTDLAAHTTLRSPQSISFSPNGELYIAESDTERINRIRVIGTDERIHDFAGAESKCNCRDESCLCFDESHVLAATAIFSTISAITVTPDGVVHVLDQGNLRIRSVMASIPQPTLSRNYEIYSPETQEMYIFNRFGHHIETRNIPTKRTVYKFHYNVNTSNGKLSSVTDAAKNKINFLRDYSGQVTVIENSRQQKYRLFMSRMRTLEKILTPDDHNITFTYHGATGLLRSRMDSTGRAHVYNYDKYGRLTQAVTPSGQVIDLSFDLSVEGARVTVTRDGESPVTMLIKGSIVTEIVGSASSVTSRLADGSLIMKNAWGHHIATETVPYSLLQGDILASSFPVPGRQRTQIGDGLVNSFEWKYFVDHKDDGSTITQVGRKMGVNGEDLLTFKYDLFSGTESILDKGQSVLLNISYDALGRPLQWSPAEPFYSVSLLYDRFGLLQEWRWGEQREDYIYDRAGRFKGITYADDSKITYSYKDSLSIKPYNVSIQGGSEHLLEYDDGGSLKSVITPRGHKYMFQMQPSVLHNRFSFTPPGSPRHPYQILYTDEGRLLAKVLPQQAGRVVYNYDEAGRLQHQIFGDGSVEYGYQPETGLVRSVTVRELAYEQRIDNKYHAGLVKEQRIRFGPAVPLNAGKLRFLYDGHARPRRIEVEINGQDLTDYEMKYHMTLGTLESIDDLRVTKSYHNRTLIQDAHKTMLRVTQLDPYGRLVEESLTIHSRLVHRLRYSYDLRGRLSSKIVWRGHGSVEAITNYTYTPDGYLQSVQGAESWQYMYDANGNMVGVIEGGSEIAALYDVSDRLVDWDGDKINTYDTAGRVIEQDGNHFTYTARGNIRHAWNNKFRVTYRHDHRGRLTSWEDHSGNVSQFFYADLLRPTVPTHIHFPINGNTHTLFYDNRGHLVAMQTENGRLWVVTDHVGTPIAVYDTSGILVKDIIRSPWGQTLRDSRPEFKLHLDFHGSLRDPVTGLLMFGLHAYDPKHGQWMAPRYDKIPRTPEHIGAVYMHRFKDNNPVNKPKEGDEHFTNIHSWLRLFDVNLSKMLGSNYHDETLDNPLNDLITTNIEPSLRVISGLSCSTQNVLQHFSRPSVLPHSLVQVDEPQLATSRWSTLGKFSSTGPVLGPGILVSRLNGRALVTRVPAAENSVVQAVAGDVLNGSALLDVTLPHHKHHILYLLKEDISAKAEDLQQLQRLSGIFNVSNHDGEHPEIRVMGPTTSLVFIYGTTPDNARNRILRHVHHRAAEHAWQAERRLLETGGPSLHPWTPEERDILLREGKVPGFTAAELHSVHRFPLLADDASNVVFRRDVDRRRRRSKPAPLSL